MSVAGEPVEYKFTDSQRFETGNVYYIGYNSSGDGNFTLAQTISDDYEDISNHVSGGDTPTSMKIIDQASQQLIADMSIRLSNK
ncbi:hypothetical protein [Methanohalobium sp.]|uniref:hypothetical protein n=1 Tax=Methanohalobium sp. TaxID=2837493 RepID=UPI0025E21146|nr:hypothetical protein [Methanohalobium sp.]